jgi:CheY-like chemotaxis protein
MFGMAMAMQPKNVLLVISNREKLHVIASFLLNNRLSVDAVPNTLDLLHRLEKTAIDLIICEIDSPWIEWQALMQMVDTIKPNANIKLLWLGEIFNPRQVAKIVSNMLSDR